MEGLGLQRLVSWCSRRWLVLLFFFALFCVALPCLAGVAVI